MNKHINTKTLKKIANEWDKVSPERQIIIENGKDVSLTYVTVPCIIRNISESNPSKVLDVGCGTGYLTQKLSYYCDFCCGIDVSTECIDIAKRKYSSDKILYLNSSIADFKVDYQFDACTANMVLMTDPEWELSLKRVYEVLKDEGQLFIMITHPCFWPIYWKYNTENWFNYNKELFIEHDFCTSLSQSLGVTTHIHRPLSMYVNTLQKIGFEIVKFEEPLPIQGTPKEYRYDYPRFLFIKCIKPIGNRN